jgi:hypothetical protein
VGHPVNKVAVIRQQDQPFGVGIQPTGGNQSDSRYPHKVGDLLLRMLIRNRGNITDGFIQRDIVTPGSRGIDRSAVYRDPLCVRIRHGARGGNDLAVDSYPTGGDNLLGVTTRGDSGGGDYFLQALWRLRLIGGRLFHIEMLPE